MPGPGGGGHGGGGGRGGSFGGGGGFGGGHSGGHHGGGHHGGGFHGGGHHGGGFYGGGFGMPFGSWGRRRSYGTGGGCCSAFLAIPLMILFMVFSVIYMILPSDNVQIEDSSGVVYNEETLQDYADDQYAKYFSDSACYEDNLLIVVLTHENYYDFTYVAWLGDHIATDINLMFGGNDTELGQTMAESVNESNYKYSLDSNLSVVMDSMRKQVEALGLSSSFTCETTHVTVTSDLVNNTDLPMTESTVEDALARFADSTGISVVIVVEDMADVFESSQSSTSSTTSASSVSGVGIALIVGLVILVVILVVSITKGKKKKEDDDFIAREKNREYRKFDDQY